jgi:uncharacterized protein YqeY
VNKKETLSQAVVEAVKAGDKRKKTTLRLALSAIKNAEVSKGGPLDDAAVLAILQKEVKSRRETAAEAGIAGRDDLVAEAEAEIVILEAFLPQPLDESALRDIVEKAVRESGAESVREMGSVMKIVMPQGQGRADGKQVSSLVREYLQG